MRNGRYKKGFTVVELVVVIAIIAILATVMIPAFTNLIRRARETADKQTMNALNKMLAVDEIEPEDIKDYKIKTEDREFAYSYSENETVIVDKSGKIVAASDEESVGMTIDKDYILASDIEDTPGGDNTPSENDNPGEDNKPDNANTEAWWNDLPMSDLSKIDGKKDIRIDDSVTSILESYFSGNTNLERIYI